MVVAHETTLDADPTLEHALVDLGFEVDWTVHDLSGPCLVAYGVHRRVAPAGPLATRAGVDRAQPGFRAVMRAPGTSQ